MSHRSLRGPAAVIGMLLVSAVHAQPAAPSGRPDPLNALASVPPAIHASAFADYRPAGEAKVGSWRKANDEVARIGGWRAYAREASQPDAAPAARPQAAPASPPASAPTRPSGHRHPGDAERGGR
jgi:hypothetical protein